MFDISWGKLVVIGVIALIVIGPKELPAVLRTVGQWMGKMRRMAAEFQGQFQDAMREAEMADLKKTFDETTSSLQEMSASITQNAENSGQMETMAVKRVFGHNAKVLNIKKTSDSEAIQPTEENVVSGKYPIWRYLYNYLSPEKDKGEIAAYLNWIRGPEGQKVVEEQGYVPNPKPSAGE